MPIYEYECQSCGEEHEIIQKISDRPLRKCPSCGALKLRRKVSRSAFHLKGSGWYVTDYAGSKSSNNNSSGDSGSKSEVKTDAGKSEGAKSSTSSSAKND